MTDTTLDSALAFYARIGAALFPMPHGSKSPTGIVGSFALDCSTDPAAWSAWRQSHPNCNFGIVAGPSNLIIMDTDAKEDRNAAWAARCALFAEWGFDATTHPPHVQSARGGWHDIFQVPDGVDARALRQPDALKGVINVRAGNGFVVAAGSYFGELPYVLLSPDQAPHPAPAALIAHCTRRTRTTAVAPPGSRDINATASLVQWLADQDTFAAYEDWLGVGMALKLEFGDAGFDVWALCHDGTVTDDVAESKWDSFASEPTAGVQTLNTWMKRAHSAGWNGNIPNTTASMFGAVAQMATAAGASLAGAIPMMAGQVVLAEIGKPILADFLDNTTDAPHSPLAADFPTLPDTCAGNALFMPLRDAISRVLAMSEAPKFKAARVVDVMAILHQTHPETYEAVRRRATTSGVTWPDAKIKLASAALEEQVQRACTPQDGWHYDHKGEIQSDNSDNCDVFLKILSMELRWNAWLERMEIKGGTDPALRWSDWTYVDDTVVAKLRTRGNRTKTRFRPGKEFFYESILSLAHANTVDPALELLATLQAGWDGVSRLGTWLGRSCGVPADAYHVAVARNIIGGIVKRCRHPGIKWDTMAILYGFQGSGKSTLATILALDPEFFTDSILLGDASKELVLSLAGKLVVEVSEMGVRGSADPRHIKAMISRTTDEGRTAYARAVSKRARRNLWLGTTNDSEPLTDPTGGRRFLPVHVDREIDLAWMRANIGQLVGEAAHREAAGESFDIPREVWGDAAERQEAARQASDAEIMLNSWFALTEHTQLAYITAMDLAQISAFAGWRNNASRGQYMRNLGFRQQTPYITGNKTHVWVRGPLVLPRHIEQDGVRYMVGKDNQGRPTVTIRAGVSAVAPSPGVQLPPVPH